MSGRSNVLKDLWNVGFPLSHSHRRSSGLLAPLQTLSCSNESSLGCSLQTQVNIGVFTDTFFVQTAAADEDDEGEEDEDGGGLGAATFRPRPPFLISAAFRRVAGEPCAHVRLFPGIGSSPRPSSPQVCLLRLTGRPMAADSSLPRRAPASARPPVSAPVSAAAGARRQQLEQDEGDQSGRLMGQAGRSRHRPHLGLCRVSSSRF